MTSTQRPTTAPGEDRNAQQGAEQDGNSLQRPTTSPGEDRNLYDSPQIYDGGAQHAAPEHRAG